MESGKDYFIEYILWIVIVFRSSPFSLPPRSVVCLLVGLACLHVCSRPMPTRTITGMTIETEIMVAGQHIYVMDGVAPVVAHIALCHKPCNLTHTIYGIVFCYFGLFVEVLLLIVCIYYNSAGDLLLEVVGKKPMSARHKFGSFNLFSTCKALCNL